MKSIRLKYPIYAVLFGIPFTASAAYLLLIHSRTAMVFDPNIWIPVFYQKLSITLMGIAALAITTIMVIGAIYRLKEPMILVLSDFDIEFPASFFKSRKIPYNQIIKIEERKDLWIKILILHTQNRLHVIARKGITITSKNYDEALSIIKTKCQASKD